MKIFYKKVYKKNIKKYNNNKYNILIKIIINKLILIFKLFNKWFYIKKLIWHKQIKNLLYMKEFFKEHVKKHN